MDPEQTSIDDIVFHIRNIIAGDDRNLLQYLSPAYKLMRCYYAENKEMELEKTYVELITQTLTYLITVTKKKDVDKRQVSEVAHTLCSFICDLQESIFCLCLSF